MMERTEKLRIFDDLMRHLGAGAKAITVSKREFSNPYMQSIFTRYQKDLLSSCQDGAGGFIRLESEIANRLEIFKGIIYFEVGQFTDNRADLSSDIDYLNSAMASTPSSKLRRKSSASIMRYFSIVSGKPETSEESLSYRRDKPILATADSMQN
uniref:Transcriptional regulator n=1 Tax=Ascaris lumbricoides TaxID=6252 RepID=A0A0M3IEX0_ASCLU